MNKYWETETPATITTGKNVLQYFAEAEKLSIARPMWTDDSGTERQGKTVTLDISALLESDAATLTEARAMFTGIVSKLSRRIELAK